MSDTGSAGEDFEQVGDRADQFVSPDRAGWGPEDAHRGRHGLLFVVFAVLVITVGAGVFTLAAGGPAPEPVDPAQLAAPVTLRPSGPGGAPGSAPASVPASAPGSAGSAAPAPTTPGPTGTQGVAASEVCPGTDGIRADDLSGWQHGSTQDPDAPCGNRYSLHATSTDGGVFYRWMSDVGQPSHCDISVYIPDTAQANVPTVHYAVLDGDTLEENFVVAQAKDRGQFVSAGSYPASGRAPLTVRMDNRSPVPGTVVASAVRFSCHPG